MMRPTTMDRDAPDGEHSADQARPTRTPPQAARRSERNGPSSDSSSRPHGLHGLIAGSGLCWRTHYFVEQRRGWFASFWRRLRPGRRYTAATSCCGRRRVQCVGIRASRRVGPGAANGTLRRSTAQPPQRGGAWEGHGKVAAIAALRCSDERGRIHRKACAPEAQSGNRCAADADPGARGVKTKGVSIAIAAVGFVNSLLRCVRRTRSMKAGTIR
jgi:hypothetical protein